MSTQDIFWLVLLVIFIAVEAGTVALASIWFAAGALAALICSLLGGPVWLQCVLFFAVSGICLAALRPVSRKLLKPKIEKTNAEALVGTTARVTKRIENHAATGQVRVDAMEWSARSTDGSILEEGALVRVDRIEGVKLFVSLLPEQAAADQ